MRILLTAAALTITACATIPAKPTIELTEQEARGFSYAKAHCAGCHAITANSASPNPEAPRFDAVVNTKGVTARTLDPRRFRRDARRIAWRRRDGGFEGRVVKGTITAIENDKAVIDVGLKSEGRVAAARIRHAGQPHGLSRSATKSKSIVDRVENADGEAMLSRDRARREAAWDKLESEFGEGKRVDGVIFGRVKGGFTVDLAAPWPSCPVRRSISARCATWPADGHAAAVPDPEDGPPPRQHRCFAPRHPRRNPRRTARRA
jgi:hypothetical protein